ncbi:hypothetical protein SDC9_116720 [bioreactor metagenome]|uniref:Uncharacterized protein n=1 Tax=bioreactor metagenome TaxID=1076179 RepID=A0A645BWV9_9ZZZZ
MRMEVDWQASFFLERFHKFLGSIWFAQSRHILDGYDVRAAFFKLLCEFDVIIECIFIAVRIKYVARIADCGFGDFSCGHGFLNRELHIGQPVKRVKYTEYVYTALGSFANKKLHDIVGIICIAYGIRSAEQHLERNIGYALAHLVKALPGRFVQESVSDIKRSAAPHFK